MKWTEENVTKLRRMWGAGHTASEVGMALGVSRDAILGKVRKLGLTRRVTMRRKDYEGTAREALKSNTWQVLGRRSEGRVTKEDVAARLAEIPDDTRTLTASVFGDPLPGRSALDRRQSANG